MAAQVVAITETSANYSDLQSVRKITWAWTTDGANGAIVDATAAGQANKTTSKYTGQIARLITNPTDSPTDNYDVTILDDDGYDVLMAGGLDRDTTNTEQVNASSLGVCLDSQLRLNIATAGNTKSGVVILYIKPF